ncbi:hypothetical protein NDU88_002289 [Pleurodeles waltl]|uniref:Uncharacterized protein n=1 Tax=Pleurodeles waltl TaxID=8319 RepID=A0AAV7T1Y0_PLEWA|nr:hypothetical protein NDU88_002289 [Pleurodeles waltl]
MRDPPAVSVPARRLQRGSNTGEQGSSRGRCRHRPGIYIEEVMLGNEERGTEQGPRGLVEDVEERPPTGLAEKMLQCIR